MTKRTLRFAGFGIGIVVLVLGFAVAWWSAAPVWADETSGDPTPTPYPYGPMMGEGYPGAATCPGGWGYGGMMGMMMGYGYGSMMGYGGMMGYGDMMGWYGSGQVEPLTVEEVEQVLEDYLKNLGKEGLAVREIMIFDNHAYAQIVEEETGIGAWEVLIDPVTKAVYPEHGPTMMWNLKYSPMQLWAMGLTPPETLPEPTISPEKAVQLAQDYLERVLPGATAEEPVPFYGYYTLHVLQDGEVVGMLSVNAYTGAVFPHTWHGRFIEMVETELHTE